MCRLVCVMHRLVCMMPRLACTMRWLVCICVVCKPRRQVSSRRGLYVCCCYSWKYLFETLPMSSTLRNKTRGSISLHHSSELLRGLTVVQEISFKIFLFLALVAIFFCREKSLILCNFDRGHYGEHFCEHGEIILNFASG